MLSTQSLAVLSRLRLPQFQGSRAQEALPEMQQPTQEPGSEMASADSPASALLAEAPGTEGSVHRLWDHLKMVPK